MIQVAIVWLAHFCLCFKQLSQHFVIRLKRVEFTMFGIRTDLDSIIQVDVSLIIVVGWFQLAILS